MIKNPKISIIIPIYNTECYLKRCLSSVVTQSLKEIEIICINDGSTDGSQEIIDQYARCDHRFVTIKHLLNQGASKARNAGILASKGEYIGFVDSDDYINNTYFEDLYSAAYATNSDICKGIVVDENHPDVQSQIDINKNIIKNKFNFVSYFTSAIYKRTFIKEKSIFFPVEITNNEDVVFLMKALLFSNKVISIDTSRYYYSNREKSASKNLTSKKILSVLKAREMIIEDLNSFFPGCLTDQEYFNLFISNYYFLLLIFIEQGLLITDQERIVLAQKISEAIIRMFKKCKIKDKIIYELKNSYPSITKYFILNDIDGLKCFLEKITTKEEMEWENYSFWITRKNEKKCKIVELEKINECPKCKISVIIPIYNTSNYLRSCLDSVINQTLQQIEIICVDDASTDNSLEIVKEYLKFDPRIILVKQDINQGEAAARNAAISIAKGEYIGFVDSDDCIDSEFYEKLYIKAVESSADIVKGVVVEEKKEDIMAQKIINKKINSEKFYFTNAFWTGIYRRSMFTDNSLKFQVGMTNGADIIFLIEAVLRANTVVTEDFAMYFYRYREDSMSKDRDYQRARSALEAHTIIINVLNTIPYENISKEAYNTIFYQNFFRILSLPTEKIRMHYQEKSLLAKYAAQNVIKLYKECRDISTLDEILLNAYLVLYNNIRNYDIDGLSEVLCKMSSPNALRVMNLRENVKHKMKK